MSSREVIRRLEATGWVHRRTRGSHRIYAKAGRIVVVPHPEKHLPIGTLKGIEKRTGVDLS